MFRKIERNLSVFLAGMSTWVYYEYGFEPATYIMLFAIIMNIPPDADVNKKCKKLEKRLFKSKKMQTLQSILKKGINMKDFTRNIKLRELQVSDFVEVENNKYELPEDFELNGKLVVEYQGDGWCSHYLEYTLNDDVSFFQYGDSFEEVLEAFNDWRIKIYADLLLLPYNETITIELRKGK